MTTVFWKTIADFFVSLGKVVSGMFDDNIPVFRQFGVDDCGPTCLRMIAAHYGMQYSHEKIRELVAFRGAKVSMLALLEASNEIGLNCRGVKGSIADLTTQIPLPCIVSWSSNHFIVVYRIGMRKVYCVDPIKGKIKLSFEEFSQGWLGPNPRIDTQGVCLIFNPNPSLSSSSSRAKEKSVFSLIGYFKPYYKFLPHICIGLAFALVIQFITPMLTQAIVDKGIGGKDMSFIYLIVAGQMALALGQAAAEYARGWLLAHASARISLSLVGDYFLKLFRLKMEFFESTKLGDILTRIGDNSRIQVFMTTVSLNLAFSGVSLVVYSVVLAYYNLTVLLVFLVGSTLQLVWVILFLKKRRVLDSERFKIASQNQSISLQNIEGIRDIKLYGAENQRHGEWEYGQIEAFQISMRSLALTQIQSFGALMIHQCKQLFITALTAKGVIDGDMTFGMMLAVQYILGQLRSPFDNARNFMLSFQDAQLSTARLAEVRSMTEEGADVGRSEPRVPSGMPLQICDVSFRYQNAHNPLVLRNVSLEIPNGKTTAIVGKSGGGKTTLIKLLLRLIEPEVGEIKLDGLNLSQYDLKAWRARCAAVFPDGYIFNDTIENNIAFGSYGVDYQKIQQVAEAAQLVEFVHTLPDKFRTVIGQSGKELSQGQRQRILLARALYRDPAYLFLDEPTNSLDAENEEKIVCHIKETEANRTTVIVAHRLSTIIDAHQIIVLENGRIAEVGKHQELLEKRGAYCDLFRTQMDLR